MGISTKHIEQRFLFFKRWSNTAYAIFNSIGKVIHIGAVSTIIFELFSVKSLLKRGDLNFLCLEEAQDDLNEEWLNKADINSSLQLALLIDDRALIQTSKNSCTPLIANQYVLFIYYFFKALIGPFYFVQISPEMRRLTFYILKDL